MNACSLNLEEWKTLYKSSKIDFSLLMHCSYKNNCTKNVTLPVKNDDLKNRIAVSYYLTVLNGCGSSMFCSEPSVSAKVSLDKNPSNYSGLPRTCFSVAISYPISEVTY